MHGDLLFLSLLPFLECTSSSETSLRTDIFFFSSLSEFLTRDRANRFSNFLVNLTIFSSYSLMRASFSLLSLTSFSSVSFMAAIFLFQLFVAIVLTRKLVSVTAKKSYYCSSLPLHGVEIEAFRGFRLLLSNKTLFATSLVVWLKVLPFV